MAVFSSTQINEIKRLRDAGPIPPDSINGNYSHIYNYIASILPNGTSVQRWFSGAAQANSGQGVYSVFIREYSAAQMKLRGLEYSGSELEGLLQLASNQVALNAIQDILGEGPNNRVPDLDGNVIAPNMDDIANADAKAVGLTLFDSIKNDSAFASNSGWAGAVLFTALDSDQTWRLLGNEKLTSAFDSLDDLRNVLFARAAFEKALSAAQALAISEVGAVVIYGDLPFESQKKLQFFIDIGILRDTAVSFDFNTILTANSIFETLIPISSNVRRVVADMSSEGNNEIIDMLRRSLFGNNISATNSDSEFATNSVSFFKLIGDASSIKLERIADDIQSLATQANSDFGALAALNGLSLYKFVGTEATALLLAKNLTLAEAWQEDQLDNQGDGLGTLNFSAHWLQDRAKLLETVRDGSNAHSVGANQLSIEDRGLHRSKILLPNGYFEDASGSNPTILGTDTIVFGSDLSEADINGLAGDDHLYGGNGNDTLSGGGGSDYLEGNADEDILYGNDGNDEILGGKGDDKLTGGWGRDLLKGGNGQDTYFFQTGDGSDTIIDSDSQGKIFFGSTELNGGMEVAPGASIWISDDGKFQYSFINEADSTRTLLVSAGSDRIYIKNFTDLALGISLQGFPDIQPVPANRTILGDMRPIDIDPIEVGIQLGYDDIENLLVDVEEVGREDYLYDSAGNDVIRSGAGDDQVNAIRGGNDRIEGGSGRDTLYGFGGNDIILGGSDGDIANGGIGNDWLFGEEELTVGDALDQGYDQSPSGLKGDWLNGSDGDDIVIGSSANDALFGGRGFDVLVGGAGR
jgi:Ca2+-binding RTX toxin-like protein